MIYESCKAFEAERIEHLETKLALQKQNFFVPDILKPEYVYIISSRVCLFKGWLTSHMRSHDNKLLKTRFTKVFQQQPTENSNQFYDK